MSSPAEQAIDTQAAHIVTLTAKLHEFVASDGHGDTGGAKGTDELELSDLDSSGMSAAGSPCRQPSTEQIQLIENLQAELLRVNQDLEDSTQDSFNKAAELEEMAGLLKDKERLLFEAGDLLQEARRHYEAQRERCEVLVREKAEATARLEATQVRLGDEVESVSFQLREVQVTVDTLRAENTGLLAEVAEMTGDNVQSRMPGAPSAGGPPASGRGDMPAPPVGRRASVVACTSTYIYLCVCFLPPPPSHPPLR